MKSQENLPYLLKLIDDDDPYIAAAVDEELLALGPNPGEVLRAQGLSVTEEQKKRISQVSAAARRAKLRSHWFVPNEGGFALDSDPDGFEGLVRMFCDYLHDGVSEKVSLSDLLDEIVENGIEALESEEVLPGLEPPECNGRFALKLWHTLVSPVVDADEPSPSDEPSFNPVLVLQDFQLGKPSSGNRATVLLCMILLGHRLGQRHLVFERENITAPVVEMDGRFFTFPGGDESKRELTGLNQSGLEELRLRYELKPSDILVEFFESYGNWMNNHGRGTDAHLIEEVLRSLGVTWPGIDLDDQLSIF